MQKTIFISILSGVEAKDILRTNIVEKLLERPDINVVLFLKSKERAELYQKEFGNPRIVFEVVSGYRAPVGNRFFEYLRFYLIRTRTLSLHKKIVFMDKRNYISFFASTLASLVLANSVTRALARFFDFYFVRDRNFEYWFEKYHPDLVFLANLFDTMEVGLLKEARRRSIATVGFINSWDKITSRGFIRLLPDKLVVPNATVKEEAIMFTGAKKKDILISGVPQYDNYVTGNISTREEFFKKSNLPDPSLPLIVFAPMGNMFGATHDWEMIDLMHQLVVGNAFIKKTALLVRFPPNDFTTLEELKKRPWLTYTLPGTRFATTRGMDWDMGFEELAYLRNTLHHCALLIACASSISIDAAVFDKPVINMNFLLSHNKPALANTVFRYGTVHYQKALRSGGIRLVNSKKDLIEWINTYLENPATDHEGRKRLVEEQCYKTDGRAGERIAQYLLSHLPR